MPTKPPSLATAAVIDSLRASNDRLNQQLHKERRRTEELMTAVHRAAKDVISGMRVGPVRAPKPHLSKKSGGAEEKALIHLSDVQLAKVTPTYNSVVAAERVDRYANKIALLTEIQRSAHPVREARVSLLGDIVEGELIFPHQPHQIDASLLRQTVNGTQILAKFLRSLLSYFERVHVVAVPGNHGDPVGGRGNRFNPETNLDRMLYLWTKDILANEPRLTWDVAWKANESGWYLVDYPFGPESYGILNFHGQQIPGSASHSDGTVAKHLFGWASGAVEEPFRYAFWGHWHRPRSSRFNRYRFWQNGSTESTNTYAQEKLAAVGFPEQYVLFGHPKRITAEYLVDLQSDD